MMKIWSSRVTLGKPIIPLPSYLKKASKYFWLCQAISLQQTTYQRFFPPNVFKGSTRSITKLQLKLPSIDINSSCGNSSSPPYNKDLFNTVLTASLSIPHIHATCWKRKNPPCNDNAVVREHKSDCWCSKRSLSTEERLRLMNFSNHCSSVCLIPIR